MDAEHGDHSHGAGVELEPEARGILVNGLRELLDLTEGMSFRETGSERFPLPLTMAICGEVPEVEEVRELVESRLEEDPVAALEGGLVLLELYEGNQAGVEEYVPADGAFLGMAFNTKRQNGWIGVLGEEDPAEVERKVNESWKFKLVEGRERRTGLYSLLNMVVRYGFVYGKIGFGDSHAMGHFVEDFAPALLICRPGMDDLELTLSLATMKIGVPAVVPEAYPFPLGRQARVEDLGEVGVATVVFANIRRLMDFPEVPVLPEYLDASHAGEKFESAVTWGETEESFYILRKGKVEKPGVEVVGEPSAAMGVVLTVDVEPMDAFDREYLEEKAVGSLGMMRGVRAQCEGGRLVIELAEEGVVAGKRIGEVLIATLRHEFPKIDRVRAEVIFDRVWLAGMVEEVRGERVERSAAIAAATEEDMDSFGVCVGCSPFAPDHVCVLTPERPPQCNRSFQMIKAGALYGYDDMSSIHHRVLHAEVNSFGMAPKGEAVDGVAGEWSGINEAASRLTGGRTNRIQLHSLEEAPTTGCGCFQMVLFQMEAGIGIMQRGFKGKAPDGRTWEDLHYALAGKQTPGVAGGAPGYLKSEKFLAAHGGWESVVWVSPKIAESMGEALPESMAVGTDTE
jgi:acetyl-CoA decarbonylase/synthase, CODH/ACS complex subunit beta